MSSGRFQNLWKCSFQQQKTCWARKTMVGVNNLSGCSCWLVGKCACPTQMQIFVLFPATYSALLRTAGQHMSFFVMSLAEVSGINESVINSGPMCTPLRGDAVCHRKRFVFIFAEITWSSLTLCSNAVVTASDKTIWKCMCVCYFCRSLLSVLQCTPWNNVYSKWKMGRHGHKKNKYAPSIVLNCYPDLQMQTDNQKSKEMLD